MKSHPERIGFLMIHKNTAYLLVATLTVGIFVLDLITPAGTADWLAFILPLSISAWVLGRRETVLLSALSTVLIVIGLRLSPPGLPYETSLFNSIMSMAIIWCTTFVLLQWKKGEARIQSLNRDLALRAQELESVNRELETLNLHLEETVQTEVDKNREKDYLLIQQNRQAAMGETLEHVAHQWRQPLAALSLFVKDLRSAAAGGAVPPEEVESFGSRAMACIVQMSETIEDFRNFFRPQREKVPFTVAEAVQRALYLVEWGPMRPSVSVREEDDAVGWGFPNEYLQVLLNLLYNARDAFLDTPGAHSIVIDLRTQEGRVVLSVADNGGGIPEEHLHRIFDPYFTTKEKGTGLGLYMSRMIVERNMQGEIRAANNGSGATFIVSIPTVPAPGGASPAVPEC